MLDKEIAVIEGNTFILSDSLGEVVVGTPHGVYHADTRFLSGYTMELNGQTPLLLGSGNVTPSSASFYATNPASPELPQGSLSIVRDRFVSRGVHDDIAVVNHSSTPLEVTLAFAFSADFADVFEVRGGNIAKAGTVTLERVNGHDLAFAYRRAEFVRSTSISFSQAPDIEGNRAIFRFVLAPKEEWRTCISICPKLDKRLAFVPCDSAPQNGDGASPLSYTFTDMARNSNFGADDFVQKAPTLFTDDARLRFAYDRAIKDMAGLRLAIDGGYQLPVAGLPWYMAIFGRDSIITALQTMLLGPELAIGTLRTLARYQSRRADPFRDEEPGKIPHEIRFGELASLGEIPHSRYYGTADATPLFIILLSEAYRWTGDIELVRSLALNLEAALRWVDEHGDMDGDGFVEYARKSLHGLVNQGWKDSPDSICFANGNLAEPPIALAEVQGYVFDAKMRAAELFDLLGDATRASELRSQAGKLKRSFNDAFWMPEEGFFAVALDGDKRRVDSVTSNPGHCLWSGIVDEDKAKTVVERLMAEDMFGGWGIRTMSAKMEAYNPLSYHNGSVWPHDNSLIAAGFMRYGFGEEAAAVVNALLDASANFPHHRLPELFSGFARRQQGFPVEYLGANSPQAWASGGVILMLQTLLGVTPAGDKLAISTPDSAPMIRLAGVQFRGKRVDLLSKG